MIFHEFLPFFPLFKLHSEISSESLRFDTALRVRMPVVDAMNRRILQLLIDDGRMTHNEIAAKLKRSPSTVRDRIRRMEDDGVILGYFTVVNNERMGIKVDAVLFANLRQGASADDLRKLTAVEEVKEVLQVTGPRRIMVRLQARDVAQMEQALANDLLPLGLEDVELRMVMSSVSRLPGG